MIETTINDAVTMRDEAAGSTGRLRPGAEILGRYVVESELGQGGMGVVYKLPYGGAREDRSGGETAGRSEGGC